MFTGEIQLIIGPMFAGKTTELMRRARRYSIMKKKVTILRYQFDTRYSEKFLCTHDKNMMSAISCIKLFDVLPQIKDCDVIGIDEGQFFPDLLKFCDQMANDGKVVIVAALDSTFEMKPFNDVCNLIPMSESVTKLDSICSCCGQRGLFTRRITNSKELVVIGGAELYIATCRKCFFSPLPPHLAPPHPPSVQEFKKDSCATPQKQNKEINLSEDKSKDGVEDNGEANSFSPHSPHPACNPSEDSPPSVLIPNDNGSL